MSKQVMRRRADENVYLHKDFHAALNRTLIFVERKFGAEAVREYIRLFAAAFYAPLMKKIRRGGLEGSMAIEGHLKLVFEREGGGAEVGRDGEDIVAKVYRCPAVSHVCKLGESLSPLFFETTRTVNETLCEGTEFGFSFDALDCRGGTCVQRFARRKP
jgi:hypothetical protein